MISTSRRNKDIAIAVLEGASYLSVGTLYNISWERIFQITRKLCLHVEVTTEHNIQCFRGRAKEIIPKIKAIPEA